MIFLILVAWAPVQAFHKLLGILLLAVLLAIGTEMLRRQILRESPDAAPSDLGARMKDRASGLLGGHGGGASDPATQRVEDLERLAALHRGGDLSDGEYATAKAELLGGGPAAPGPTPGDAPRPRLSAGYARQVPATEPPPPAQSAEDESVDRRTSLAGERTLLAWWRTGFTAIAVALAVGRVLPELAPHSTRWPYVVIGVGFGLYGIALIAYGTRRIAALDAEVGVAAARSAGDALDGACSPWSASSSASARSS